MNIVESAEKVTQLMKECITSEMTPDGLLSDVLTFIPSYRLDEPMDEPCIWLFEHPTVTADPKRGKLSHKLYLSTNFEFVCIVYDDDIEASEILGKNLASRVLASIMKHAVKVKNNERIINDVIFNTLYPAGEVQIEGKSNRTPATSIVVEVRYYIDWLKCKSPGE